MIIVNVPVFMDLTVFNLIWMSELEEVMLFVVFSCVALFFFLFSALHWMLCLLHAPVCLQYFAELIFSSALSSSPPAVGLITFSEQPLWFYFPVCLQIPYLMADLFFILQLMNFGLRAFSSHEQCIVFIFWTDLMQFLTIFSEFYIVHLLDLLFMTFLFEYLKCRHCSVLDCPADLSSALYIHCFTGGPSPFLCSFRQIQKHHFLYIFLFCPLQIYSWTFPPFTLCLLTWQLQAS